LGAIAGFAGTEGGFVFKGGDVFATDSVFAGGVFFGVADGWTVDEEMGAIVGVGR